MKFKCLNCSLILDGLDLVDYKCPICHEKPTEMCENDHVCTCKDDVHDGIRYCEKCGATTCPCGSEDVSVVTRVKREKIRSFLRQTGYLQTLESFNQGKAQEVRDRHRTHNITETFK